jgi:hypothetical protein
MNLPHNITRHTRRLAGCLALLAGSAAIAATPALADHSLETIVQDDTQLLHRSDAEVDASMAQLAGMGVDRVRLTAGWSVIAPDADATARPAFDEADPGAYPAHAWDNLDRAVRDAAEHGLKIDIDIAFWAPLWATADTAPGRARTSIDPERYAGFAQAVARRYSGTYTAKQEAALPLPPPSKDGSLLNGLAGLLGGKKSVVPAVAPAPKPLPGVDMFTIWNEPNLGGFLKPQWKRTGGRWQPESPHIYRRLVQAAYPVIKAIVPEAIVLVGGTASGGAGPGSSSVGPLRFLREMACVDDRLRPLKRSGCSGFKTIPGDGFAHHPYSLMKSPGEESRNPDWATISELPRLTGLLDALVDRGRLSPALRDVWLTEFGYETNDQVGSKRYTGADQARFLAWSEYIAWRTPHVRSFAQFLLRDTLTDEAVATPGRRAFGSWQSGLLREDGTPKPAADSFPATLFAQYKAPGRTGRATVRAARTATTTLWVHLRFAREPTPVQIEQQVGGGPWTPVADGARTTDDRGYLLVRVASAPRAALRVTWQEGQDRRTSPAHVVKSIAKKLVRPRH